MRIAVVGAGAIGACFGAMLAEAGCEVSLIARGAHLDAIRANGLTIRRGDETRTRRLAASDKAVEIGPVEVVLFCVKLWSVEEAGEASQPLMSTGCARLCRGRRTRETCQDRWDCGSSRECRSSPACGWARSSIPVFLPVRSSGC